MALDRTSDFAKLRPLGFPIAGQSPADIHKDKQHHQRLTHLN
jgi:hypothetical protein